MPVSSVEKLEFFRLGSFLCEDSLSRVSRECKGLFTLVHVIFAQFYRSPVIIKAALLRYFSHPIKFTCLKCTSQ